MIYKIDDENQKMVILDLYCSTPQSFIVILKFLKKIQPNRFICPVALNRKNTDKNIKLYEKIGFRIFKIDEKHKWMGTTFENYIKNSKSYLSPRIRG